MKITKIEPQQNRPTAYDKMTLELTRAEFNTLFECIEFTAEKGREFNLLKRAVFAHEHLSEAMKKTTKSPT